MFYKSLKQQSSLHFLLSLNVTARDQLTKMHLAKSGVVTVSNKLLTPSDKRSPLLNNIMVVRNHSV